MNVRLRFAPRDIRNVEVREPKCPSYACFYASRHVIRSPAGASGCSSRSTQQWECGTRERHGCPPAPVMAVPIVWQKRGAVWHNVGAMP